MEENPYAPSQVTQTRSFEVEYFDSLPSPPWPAFWAIYKEWEWKRLLYNLLYIACITLLILYVAPKKKIDGHWLYMFLDVIAILNLTYFIGPALECYITWLKQRRIRIQKYLFLGGLALSLLVSAQQPIIEFVIKLFR